MPRQAVITGLGIVSPIGTGVEKFWEAARAGRSGIGRPTLFDASGLPSECQIVGEVRDFNPLDWMSPGAARMAGRFSQFAVAAAKMARTDSYLDEAGISPDRLRVSIGSVMSGQTDLGEPTFQGFLRGETVWPWTSNEYSAHAATSHVAIAAGARGQAMTLATACAAGLDSISWAADCVTRSSATAVIAGATETPLSPYILSVFHSVGVLSRWKGQPEQASRPFDRLRSGLVLAEGAAAVIVEDREYALARGVKPYAEILGYASVTEGAHLRKVDETGEVGALAMQAALNNAGVFADEVDLIVAHGNSMQDYDVAETAAIKRTFGSRAWNVPISSLKSMCGQALGASSAMQVVLSCLAFRDAIVSPTINHSVRDERCDLDYVTDGARVARLRRILIHAHSLGGSHVALVLGSPD
jgi:3-oxoacyl-[acyl-carrier-protein] synthase II